MTANDVQNGKCAPTTLIFARGTTEQGNMGMVVGPPLANQLISAMGGNVAVQGVNYPADVEGAAEGSINPKGSQGSLNMAMFTNMALQACPSTKVVLAGYSQGAQQVHGALMNLQPGQVSVRAVIASLVCPLIVSSRVGCGHLRRSTSYPGFSKH